MGALNLFADDLTLSADDDLRNAFTELTLVAREAYRLELTSTVDSDKICKNVAAFANTFGGLLFIGVEDKSKNCVGVERPTNSDLKTRIVSIITARISPTPRFEVRTFPFEPGSSRDLVIVKVMPGTSIYLDAGATVKNPIFVRVEDESKPANADQVRALLNRISAFNNVIGDATIRAENPCRQPYIVRPRDRNWNDSFRSEDYLEIAVLPTYPAPIALDRQAEQWFGDAVRNRNPETLSSTDQHEPVEDSGHTWFSLRLRSDRPSQELLWVLREDGGVHHTRELKFEYGTSGDRWSPIDLLESIIRTVDLAQFTWAQHGNYSDARAICKLHSALGISPCENGCYLPGFLDSQFAIRESSITHRKGPYAVESIDISLVASHDEVRHRAHDLAARLALKVFRQQRFSVDFDGLMADLRGRSVAI